MHRTARVLKLLGSLLTVGLLAASCTVESSNGDDDVCDPGTSASCTCPNGSPGMKQCNATGSAYAACSCSTASGGSGNGGSSNSGGSSNGGGQGGEPASSGGSPSDGGAAGAVSSGGAGGDPGTGGDPGSGGDPGAGGTSGSGGTGGSGGTNPTCDECIATPCMTELDTCQGDATCTDELACLMVCMELEREDLAAGTLLPNEAITDACVADCQLDAWPGGIDSMTREVLDCMAGKDDWDVTDPPHWSMSPCRDACFGPLP